MEISYSEFKLYNECPNKYFLTKYIKVPYTDARASFPGTVIQKVMEYFYNDKIYLTNSKVSEWLGTKIVEVHRSLSKYYQLPWVPNEEETLLAEYPLYLNKIVDTIKEHKLLSKIADSEVYIKHPLNELPMAQDLIIGKMDFRITKDDQLWILDGKFSKWGTKYLDQDQLIWYALLEKLKNGKYPTQLGWWLYRQGDIQWIEWNEDRIFELKGRILDAFKDIHRL